jgi:hypothetical protein
MLDNVFEVFETEDEAVNDVPRSIASER